MIAKHSSIKISLEINWRNRRHRKLFVSVGIKVHHGMLAMGHEGGF